MAVLLFGEILNVEFFPVKNVIKERKKFKLFHIFKLLFFFKYGVRNTKYNLYLISSSAV